jgi:solute carrier family 45, member 1/2/4
MAIPPVPDADPDPTTQITWPSRSFRRIVEEEHEAPARDHSTESSSSRGAEENVKVSLRDEPNRAHLTTWNLITLSLAMGGSQVAWTVELGYVHFPSSAVEGLMRSADTGRHFYSPLVLQSS